MSFPNNIVVQQQGQQGRIDMRRLEAARANRQIQLRKWDEYDRKMRSSEGARHSSKSRTLVNFQSNYVLIDAVLRDDIDEVRELLEKGMNPNVAKDDGLTPLHQACINNSVEMCELLVRYGADVNCRDADQWTPLHAAAASCHVDVCEFLLEHGADILAINVDGSIPYDLAEDEETSHFLVTEIHRRGYSPADVEAVRSEPEKVMIKDILQRYSQGDDLSKLDEQGAAPIHVAAACGYLDVACILLRIGIDPDLLDADGWTPAHVAACWRQDEVVQTLVSYGADLTLTTPDGQTAFSLCETDDQQEHLLEIWNNREALRMQLEADTSFTVPRPLQRKRSSSSSVHRSSLREKSNLSKREVIKEMEIARSTGSLLPTDSMENVFPESATDTSRVIVIDKDQKRVDSNPSASSDTLTPNTPGTPVRRRFPPAQKETTIKIVRPPTGYDLAMTDFSDGEPNVNQPKTTVSSTKDHVSPAISNESVALTENTNTTTTGPATPGRTRINIVDRRGSAESRNRQLMKERMQGTGDQANNTPGSPKPQLLTPYEAKPNTNVQENDQVSDTSSRISNCCKNCTIL